ncbi:sensor histidine kinase [Cognatishimia activa]|uniref:histidine kinase n=1 Tax=Cognatishimia activa TaxID=1715691 RepID=A0A0N7MBZ2_9RHOB|nr:ATP-binding protein [Cognatishimia activa]CUI76984.1 C4-dicarboxylate transport sensor protein DctB [Cognatishimia activa]CUK26760.1 C4-dicarboxylate transport sensor protein DctB [Cognatishimia activa]
MASLRYILPLLATIALSVIGFQVSHSLFTSQEQARAEGRLSLYRSSVVAEIDRFSHLTYVLARDSFVLSTAEGGETDVLNKRLNGMADAAGLDAIYLMTTEGLTVAASNHDDPSSFVGQNYGFRPYFRDALAGDTGQFYAIGATTGLPGYFIADPVLSAGGTIEGVIAIKIAFANLEDRWRNAGEQVFLANEDGVILLSSQPEWRYRTLGPLSDQQRATIQQARQFTGQPLAPLDWKQLNDQKAEVAGVERIYLRANDLPHGWTLHYFASDDQAIARSWLVAALIVLLAGALLIAAQVQRARRVARALARSEKEEAILRSANERLAVEIDERRTAERRLQRTQKELEQASRLAALGQLAASVTHELGQPIAAMRNHVAAAEIGTKADTRFTGKIGGLVDRMEGITRQLKFFARSEDDPFQDVDLCAAMRAALALVEPNITTREVQVDLTIPKTSVTVRGNRLRLEQVMTNLLRNAIDAMEDSDARALSVTLDHSDGAAWFEIRDTGHGLGEATLADLQEPFVTSRESGQGMGLGLAISASIVNDHGGQMTARNAQRGGAVFRVTLPIALSET